MRVQLRMEAFNVLNKAVLSQTADLNVNSNNFGLITATRAASNPRILQFGADVLISSSALTRKGCRFGGILFYFCGSRIREECPAAICHCPPRFTNTSVNRVLLTTSRSSPRSVVVTRPERPPFYRNRTPSFHRRHTKQASVRRPAGQGPRHLRLLSSALRRNR